MSCFFQRVACAIALVALTGAGLAAVAVPAHAVPGGRVIIGDSVTGMNPAALRARGFTVNYAVSRQFSALPKILRSFGKRLPRNVVVHLGTNGTISLSECKAAVRKASSKRTVFFVTVRAPVSWESTNNRTLRTCDRSFKGPRVRIIDWHRLSDRRDDWFYRDGYHPVESTGGVAYARLVDRAVDRNRR
jgi:hypothetical protein